MKEMINSGGTGRVLVIYQMFRAILEMKKTGNFKEYFKSELMRIEAMLKSLEISPIFLV